MNRKIDVKALVSHIIKGDGADRCRICMGDTSDGQVFLGDTVILDGERAVTLAELLESLTGVEVTLDAALPPCVCAACSGSVIDAANFRTLCRESTARWVSTLELLQTLPTERDIPKRNKGIFVIVEDDTLTIVNDCSGGVVSERFAAHRLKSRLTQMHNNDHRQRLSQSATRCRHRCPDCGKTFFYAHHLYLHLSEASDDRRACPHCAEIMRREELILHLSRVHGRRPHACRKCPALLKTQEQYALHMKKAHARGAYTCGDCGRTYRSNQALNAHVPVHAIRTCPGCRKVYRNQQCFSYHVKKCCDTTKEDDDVQERTSRARSVSKIGPRGGTTSVECFCDYCGKRFSGKKYIKAHIQIVHSTATHRHCVYCGKFLAAAHMTEHVKKHELVRSYTCNYCGIVLKSDLGIKQHLRLHTGEKPYKCKFCNESFSASSRRSEHISKVHRTDVVCRHACHYCPAKFKLPFQLRKHLATVHTGGDEEGPQFKCDKCGEKFGSCRGLIHHSRKHQRLLVATTDDKGAGAMAEFKVYSEPTLVMYDANIIQ